MRTVGILVAVAGLIATVALPAAAASLNGTTAEGGPRTLQQAAQDAAQTLVVASDATTGEIARDSYAATTPEEIEKKKAEEAALARAKAAAEAAAAAAAANKNNNNNNSSGGGGASYPTDVPLVAPGSGAVRWPLMSFDYIGDGFRSRGGSHEGVDLLAPAMTPIYAAAAGVVSVSSEGFYGYGVAVEIEHVLGGQRVKTTYGHMTYGTRQVSEGQSVEVGQLIGYVGSTGRSTANHLHFEVRINDSLVDPIGWLDANAG